MEESKEKMRRPREAGDQFQKKLCEVDVSIFRPRAERRTEDADDNKMYNIINLEGVVQRVTTQVCYMSGLNAGSYRLMGKSTGVDKNMSLCPWPRWPGDQNRLLSRSSSFLLAAPAILHID